MNGEGKALSTKEDKFDGVAGHKNGGGWNVGEAEVLFSYKGAYCI